MWWANYTATRPANYQVSWGEFREGFHAHHIPAGVMRMKHQEFMDLKQGGRSVHEYSKLFNHLAQYALEQVDTDEKKKDHFMNALLTKLQEHVALSMGGTFPDFVSNAIITDDKIRAHKEGKKRKVMATSSNSAPPKYRVVYPPPHPPTSHANHTSSSSGLPAHLSVHTSRQHRRLCLHHRLCCVYWHHLLPGLPPATPASIIVAQATLLESALLQRRTQLKAPSILHLRANRGWSLLERVVSTTPPWRRFPRASKSS
jgi:hypothetical protein